MISVSYPDLCSYNRTEAGVCAYSGYVYVCLCAVLSLCPYEPWQPSKPLSTKYNKEIKVSELIEFLQVSWKLVARWRQETYTGRKVPTSYQRNCCGQNLVSPPDLEKALAGPCIFLDAKFNQPWAMNSVPNLRRMPCLLFWVYELMKFVKEMLQ